ncbi:CLUMA_CG004574, isoform A [Clunio marinus]|uniref:CLUMA_CG004574, isoform A n=1 Tax=Clunio marinus TaxID=568069 RepID=A0A1J1HS98_9DIPT|nr:CLUMA_CG004574, isoform A [Clunio marinus]
MRKLRIKSLLLTLGFAACISAVTVTLLIVIGRPESSPQTTDSSVSSSTEETFTSDDSTLPDASTGTTDSSVSSSTEDTLTSDDSTLDTSTGNGSTQTTDSSVSTEETITSDDPTLDTSTVRIPPTAPPITDDPEFWDYYAYQN